jgi:hypothetical protein
MDITKISLDQSADAFWIPVDHIPPKGIGGGEQRHFSTLTNAVLFIMKDLPPRDRGTAWITLYDGSLTIEKIEELHKRITGLAAP